MKAFKQFESLTKDIKGVYCIIATVGCLFLSMGINPIAIAVLCVLLGGGY